MDAIKKFLFVTIVVTMFVALNGIVLMYLWNWHIASTFTLTNLSFAQACGIILLINLIFSKNNGQIDDLEIKETLNKIKWQTIQPVLSLAIGYLLHLLM